jgi:hypothetical protein
MTMNRHLGTAAVLIIFLAPRAATGARSDVLAVVETIGSQLRNVQDDDVGGAVPRDAQKLLPQFRHALRDFVAASLAAEPELSPEGLKGKLTRALESTVHSVQDAQAGPYGNKVGIEMQAVPGAKDLLVATVTISVKCGSDTALYIFDRSRGKVRLLFTAASQPYGLISGAWGHFGYSVSALDDGSFVLMAANVNPWCSSNWQGLRYSLYRINPVDGGTRLFADKRTIWIGADPAYTVAEKEGHFELTFAGESPKDPGSVKVHKLQYEAFDNGVKLVDLSR